MSVRVCQRDETVSIEVSITNKAGTSISPDQGVRLTLTDEDGIIEVCAISVVASTLFTVGLTVTGGTSEATGVVVAKPDGTTLQLEGVIGTWQSGEAITDSGAGTSTTSSILMGALMSEDALGEYIYNYNTQPTDTAGNWKVKIRGQDGTGTNAKVVIEYDHFQLQ